MVSDCSTPLAGGRLLVATFTLPNTISFQVPSREKDGRFRTPSHSNGHTQRARNSFRTVPSPIMVPPPMALDSPAMEAFHGSVPVPVPSSPGHFRTPSTIDPSGGGPKPIPSKADRLKEHERPATARGTTPPPSILSQPPSTLSQPENKGNIFPATEPRAALNQPRSRISRSDDMHHHRHQSLSLDTQVAITTTESSSEKGNTTSPGQSCSPMDSAKVFANAKWTVERAYGGNIGLQNAVNSIQGQLSKLIWIGTLGMATDTLTDRTRGDIRAELALNHHSIPVFVNDHDFEGHYHQFCKQVLWPIFHYVLPDNLRSKGYEDGSWKHYVAVNRAFADTIVENYMDGDTIWVNDYHLMLVPNMIRERLPDASIGFFLHIPFPSSEIFKCLHVRKEVLEGLLGADLVGFQTYSFARHFLQTCSRLLAVETNPKGIQLENTAVNVGIFPIGIDIKSLNVKRQDPEVAKWVKVLKEKYAGMKLIVARDKLDYIKGVRQKMLAFERFLNLYPEYQGKIVLIQVALSTSEQNEVQGQVSDVVTRINSRFSDLSYQPIVFLRQDITFSQYLGLLTVADLCLITSLRDGMNLTSHEYVVCQEEQKNPLVLSEFAGTYGSLGACLRVNPWNYTEVATAIHDALEMKQEEKAMRWNELRKHVCTNTAQFWAQGFVSELVKVHGDMQRRYSIHIPLLDLDVVMPHYRTAKRRLLLLDYDGTLLPYERSLSVRSKGTTSTEEMIKVVTDLAQDPKNVVYIMSGRTRSSLEQTFGSIPNVGLCAEGGCFLKHANKTVWEDQTQQGNDMQWRKKVMEMFEYYKERTPGSEIEEKSIPIVWHYRQADNPNYGLWQARECQNHIEEAIGSIYPVHAVVGRKCLEVMPRDVSKAFAAKTIIESLVQLPLLSSRSGSTSSLPLSESDQEEDVRSVTGTGSEPSPLDFVLCIGDDRSDEDMFQYVNGLDKNEEDKEKTKEDQQQQHPLRIVTCTVGSKSSEARWFVPGVTSVLQGLQLLADSASADSDSVDHPSSSAPVEVDTLQTAAAAVVPKVMALVGQ
ncbi:MAG: trehalose phosphate synthase subunit [Benniella sp.]|nr:MAG: trehalose phosphate synthase subunit [Benniella sp.]